MKWLMNVYLSARIECALVVGSQRVPAAALRPEVVQQWTEVLSNHVLQWALQTDHSILDLNHNLLPTSYFNRNKLETRYWQWHALLHPCYMFLYRSSIYHLLARLGFILKPPTTCGDGQCLPNPVNRRPRQIDAFRGITLFSLPRAP
ncbi:hypothetical protein PILCRDRAFT_290058 [Piloderma croceum F 1598]|uniref:Uncharacterized protein n=1 Tax=Piloderma croceum (strain F 1598) TaxID=765440 RepID=A0A0C3G4V3_PILCF|nr:hypothetical protein PILCRDRAFT_290058 [Piloderma croceum F 1598]